jgi:integrase
MRLTAKTIADLELPPGKSDAIYFDQDLAGYGLRLRAGAGGMLRRSYVAQYRTHGRTRRVLIGSAEKLTPDQARKAATKVLAEVALGGDPQHDKQERRGKDKHSLRSVIDEYLAAKESRVRPRTMFELRRYLTGAYFRPLHVMPIDRITRRDVAIRLAAITRENTAIVAGHARTALSAMFAWAMTMGLAEHNAVVGTHRPDQPAPRDRVLDDSELAAIWRACKDDDAGRLTRLLILVAARRSEIGGMTWSEIDLDRGIWTLPKERSKNARAHTLPLPQMALDIIAAVPRRVSRDHLFGERAARGFTKWDLAKRELDARLGKAVQPWRLHDLRRTCATRLADLDIAQPHIIETILNHHSGFRRGVSGIYNRSSYQREIAAALALWADHVRAITEGGARKVVPMRPLSITGP